MGFNEITHHSVTSFSQIIETNTVLKTLDLSWHPGYASINHINHGGQQGGILLNSLEKNSTLTDLHLGYVANEKCIAPLTQTLANLPHLTRIGLKSATFQQGEAESLGRVLKNHPSLTNLELEGSSLENGNEPCEEIIKPLSENLCFNTTLKILSFRQSNINILALKHISTLLFHNYTITHLDISDSHGLITDEGIPDLVKALSTNISLTYLNISNHKLSFKSLSFFSPLLPCNSSLRELVLTDNKLDGPGEYLDQFLDALKKNTTLLLIDLSNLSTTEFYKQYIRNEFHGRVTI
jgi:NLR family CARD domain-containing protein 3